MQESIPFEPLLDSRESLLISLAFQAFAGGLIAFGLNRVARHWLPRRARNWPWRSLRLWFPIGITIAAFVLAAAFEGYWWHGLPVLLVVLDLPGVLAVAAAVHLLDYVPALDPRTTVYVGILIASHWLGWYGAVRWADAVTHRVAETQNPISLKLTAAVSEPAPSAAPTAFSEAAPASGLPDTSRPPSALQSLTAPSESVSSDPQSHS